MEKQIQRERENVSFTGWRKAGCGTGKICLDCGSTWKREPKCHKLAGLPALPRLKP
jgi:hypothetical protein